jgi:TolB amino-terminal domain
MSKRASLHEPGGLTRRGAVVCIGAAAGTVALSASRLRAIEPIPIALPVFLAGATDLAELACSIPGVITANLERSGLFAPLDQAAFIEKIASYDAIPHFVDWRAINAQALVTGRVTRLPDRRGCRRVPALGCGRCHTTRRPAILQQARQFPPHRSRHFEPDLRKAHGRKGLL